MKTSAGGYKFAATIDIIGINPFVFIPADILEKLFRKAGKDKGPIPVKGSINNTPFKQTLVRYSGHWRLYINTSMLNNSPQRIGELIEVRIEFDPEKREMQAPPDFMKALAGKKKAKEVFNALPPSRRNEIVKYLANIKTAATLQKNIDRAILFLLGKERFIGRDKPL